MALIALSGIGAALCDRTAPTPSYEGRCLLRFCRDFLGRVRAIPGVVAATLGSLPGHESGSGVTIAGQPKIEDAVKLNYIDTDYLPMLGITLRAGRNLTEQDITRGDRVAGEEPLPGTDDVWR